MTTRTKGSIFANEAIDDGLFGAEDGIEGVRAALDRCELPTDADYASVARDLGEAEMIVIAADYRSEAVRQWVAQHESLRSRLPSDVLALAWAWGYAERDAIIGYLGDYGRETTIDDNLLLLHADADTRYHAITADILRVAIYDLDDGTY